MPLPAEPPIRDSVPRVIPLADPVPMTLLPARTWTHEEWTHIQQGYVGRDMGAKWDVLVDGRVAVVRRSWTGHIFYEATFEPVDGGRWWIGSAVTGADDRRSRSPGAAYAIDEYHGVMLEWLISGIALGEADDELQYRVEAVIEQQHPAAEGLPRLILHTMLGLREIL